VRREAAPARRAPARGDVPAGPGASAPEFDAMAKWYDFDYDRRMRKDLPYYLGCAREGGNPVLELGAGTGRVTAVLAKAGFDVTAMELSPRMLELAEQRMARTRGATGRVRLLLGDMAADTVRGRFGTVLVPFRTFNHMYTVDRQLAALRNIRARLAPGGLAVIDLWNPDLPDLAREEGKWQVSYERKDPRTGHRVVQRFRVQADWPRQLGYLDYRWDEYRGKRKVGSDVAPMRWRWFHRYEFEHLLARAGLRVLRLHGDFDGNELRRNSEDLLFVIARA
jgi:SAM-dependent methyltransferase